MGMIWFQNPRRGGMSGKKRRGNGIEKEERKKENEGINGCGLRCCSLYGELDGSLIS